MSAFAPFSTEPYEQAAAAQRAGLGQARGYYEDAHGTNRDLFQRSRRQTRRFDRRGREALEEGYGAGYDLLGEQRDIYSPYQEMAINALGLGGPEGTAAAHNAFMSFHPGVTGAIDTANEAIMRRMAHTGMLASGNTLKDIGKSTANIMYNQAYVPWLNEITRGRDQYGQTTGRMADMMVNRGRDLGQSYSGTGAALRGINAGQVANNWQFADKMGQNYVDMGNVEAMKAMAPAQVGQNMWNLGTNLIKGGAGAYAQFGRT